MPATLMLELLDERLGVDAPIRAHAVQHRLHARVHALEATAEEQGVTAS